jgi:DHA1 family bicyclomycin/chloramphenicol resistance-like MFS transporter
VLRLEMSNRVKQEQKDGTDISFVEFVALMASMMSLAALSTDAMLPALPKIGADLGVQNPNANQLIISLLFFGIAAGQLIYGPLSDSVGRKPAIYAGYAVFITGCLVSMFAGVFWVMLAGRLLQGLGAAGPRGVLTALIRDKYAGRLMARVMSIIMTVFILVPVIAPTFGQAVLLFAGWRAIFAVFLLLAVITLAWFALRQPETLAVSARMPLSARRIGRAFRTVLSNRIALGYTIAAGLINGAFLGYLSSSQQILQVQYGLGTKFTLVFALLALSLGSASLMNSRLVMRYGMRFLATRAGIVVSVLGVVYLIIAFIADGHPPLWALILYLMASFFGIGILFGNLNALAMEPLGAIAGVGAAVVGSLQTFIATPLGIIIGQSYNGTVIPLVFGIAVMGIGTVLAMRWAEGGGARQAVPAESTF